MRECIASTQRSNFMGSYPGRQLLELPVPTPHLPVRRLQRQPRQQHGRRSHSRRLVLEAAVVEQRHVREVMRAGAELQARLLLAIVTGEVLHERVRRGAAQPVVERREQRALHVQSTSSLLEAKPPPPPQRRP